MIIIKDQNYPVVIMIFDKFYEFEYKTLIKNLEYFSNKTIQDDICFKLYIDLYNLQDYSYSTFNTLLTYLYNKHYPKLDTVKIFFNKENTSYITKGIAYANNITNNNFKIHIIELENQKKW
tara:strand:+ start:3485 stop:3847 length:363 start_codon:yes stop_codon:yes gene_type:complete